MAAPARLTSSWPLRARYTPLASDLFAATDLLGGQVEYYFAAPQTVIPYVKAGKLRALAVSSAKRLPVLPDVPTLSESGYDGFETSDWKMLFAPSGTSAEIVKRVNAEVAKAMSGPEMLSQLLAEGSVPMSGSPKRPWGW